MSGELLSAEAGAALEPGLSPRRLLLGRFLEHRLAVVSLCFLLLLGLLVAAAPIFEAWLGITQDSVDLFNRSAGPSAAHPLGTDELGRDLLLRLLYGGRVSLLVALAAALGSMIMGSAIGILAGYRGGWLDSLLMRLTDGVIALPLLPLLIVLAAIDPAKIGLPVGTGASDVLRIVLIIVLFGWTTVARLVRGAALSLREREFVLAAEALGAGPGRIMARHILPNCASPILVATTLSVGNIILLESVLSFLGLGIQPPLPSWGNMLTGAQDLIYSAPQLAVWPGLLIFATVIAFNFLGDGLQDALDPKASRRI
jgi:peptide/nickel transport system permease protein